MFFLCNYVTIEQFEKLFRVEFQIYSKSTEALVYQEKAKKYKPNFQKKKELTDGRENRKIAEPDINF